MSSMIGIGKWKGSINIQILKFSGDVYITIDDKGGEYAVDIQLPPQLEKVKHNFDNNAEYIYRGILSILSGDADYLLK